MVAAAITEKKFNRMPGINVIAQVPQATQYDWVMFEEWKGVSVLSAKLIGGTEATLTRGTLEVNNTGTAYSATTLSIAYDEVDVGHHVDRPAATTSFYIMTTSGEIIEVTDATPTATSGTLVVLKRGCFGTTASGTGLADEAILYVLNTFTLGDNQTSPIEFVLLPYPNDPGVKLFAA